MTKGNIKKGTISEVDTDGCANPPGDLQVFYKNNTAWNWKKNWSTWGEVGAGDSTPPSPRSATECHEMSQTGKQIEWRNFSSVLTEIKNSQWKIYIIKFRTPSPPWSDFLHFHAVFGTFWSINRLPPPPPLGVGAYLWEILDPLLIGMKMHEIQTFAGRIAHP